MAGRFDRMRSAMSSALIYAFAMFSCCVLSMFNEDCWFLCSMQPGGDLSGFLPFVPFSFFFGCVYCDRWFNNLGKPFNSFVEFGRPLRYGADYCVFSGLWR